MKDGTYLKLGGTLHRVESVKGYWAASSETTLDKVSDGEFVGLWTDNTGRLWVDNTHYFTDYTNALQFAREHNQLAIWSVTESRALDTAQL